MGSLYSRYFTTRLQVGLILFFTYIYDSVRAGYLESRRKQFEKLSPTYSYLQHARVLPMTFDRRGHQIPSKRSSIATDVHIHCTTNNQRQSQRKTSLLQAINQLTSDSGQRVVRLFMQSTENQSDSTADQVNRRHTGAGEKLYGYDDDYDDFKSNQQGPIDDCPLKEMPKFARIYQYFSHVAVTVTFLKYLYLTTVQGEFFGTNKIYTCYIPGRTVVLTAWSPHFTLMVINLHVIYRIYLCLIRKSFHIESIIFVLCNEKQVVSLESTYNAIKQRQDLKQSKSGDLYELYKLFLSNRMFFTKSRSANHGYTYKLKINRTLEHWLKLKGFINKFTQVTLANFVVWSGPLGILILSAILSVHNTREIYSHCDELNAESDPMKRTFFSWRGIIWFIGDMMDSGWLLFDTTNALAWPFTSVVVCAQDTTYGLQELIKSAASISLRLEQWLILSIGDTQTRNLNSRRGSTAPLYEQARKSALSSIHDDILMLQSDINGVLHDMGNVDQFVSKMAAFIIFSWLYANTYYQLISLFHNELAYLDFAIQFMQFVGLCCITGTFVFLSKTHKVSRQLYDRICHLVAIDPDYKTKSSWLSVLEYYNKDKSRFSFHIGAWAQLTFCNYLKGMAWLITSALVIINLFKYKYNNPRMVQIEQSISVI